jgi:hypothetical protein
MGKRLIDKIDSGELDPQKVNKIVFELGTPNATNYPPMQRIFLALGSPNTILATHSGCAIWGMTTFTLSAAKLISIQNPVARMFFLFSLGFLASGASLVYLAVQARACSLSTNALLHDGLGSAFLYLGNQAHRGGLFFEGNPMPTQGPLKRPVPVDLLKRLRRPQYFDHGNNNGVTFIRPNCFLWTDMVHLIESIPFQKLGKIVAIDLSLYGYGKFLVVTYRYGQQFVTKLESKRKLRKQKKQIIAFAVMLILRTKPALYFKCLV